MEYLKNRKDFLTENIDSINWNKVERFVNIIRHDFQLDDTDDGFIGFINLDPSDMEDSKAPWSFVSEFMKALERGNESYNKLLKILDKKGLKIESAQSDELIINEKKHIYRDMDPEEYLISRGAIKTDKGWNCDFKLNGRDNRTPLVKNGKFTVQFNKVKSMNFNKCNLTSLKGIARYCDGDVTLGGNYVSAVEIKWYTYIIEKNEGYEDYWASLLMFVLNRYPKEINTINWPEGYLDEHLKKSAKALGKYDL